MYIAPASWPDDISGNSGDRSSFARVAGVGNPERLEDCLPALRFTAGYASFSSRLASPPSTMRRERGRGLKCIHRIKHLTMGSVRSNRTLVSLRVERGSDIYLRFPFSKVAMRENPFHDSLRVCQSR